MTKNEAIALWKENGIERCEMPFYCGGDEMGEYSFEYYDVDDNEVKCKELDVYFDEEVFKNIDFYVNSDGHYMGESGSVHITIDDLEDEDIDFDYVKSAESEFNETIENELKIELTDEEINYLKEYVSGIIGGYDEDCSFNYTKDFIMTDEYETIEKNIATKIDDIAKDYEPYTDNEIGDWYNYESNDDMFEDNKLLIIISNETTMFTSSND